MFRLIHFWSHKFYWTSQLLHFRYYLKRTFFYLNNPKNIFEKKFYFRFDIATTIPGFEKISGQAKWISDGSKTKLDYSLELGGNKLLQVHNAILKC